MSGTVQIYKKLIQHKRISYKYYCKIETFAYGEINERDFSNHQPRS